MSIKKRQAAQANTWTAEGGPWGKRRGGRWHMEIGAAAATSEACQKVPQRKCKEKETRAVEHSGGQTKINSHDYISVGITFFYLFFYLCSSKLSRESYISKPFSVAAKFSKRILLG